MSIHIKIITLFAATIIGIQSAFAHEASNCDTKYLDLWRKFDSGENATVKEQLNNCTFSNPIAQDSMNVLKGILLYDDEKYQESLNVLSQSQQSIESAYNSKTTIPRLGESENDIGYIYFAMLQKMADSNFMLKKYGNALSYYNEWITSAKRASLPISLNILNYSALCYYFLEQYDHAIERLKDGYSSSIMIQDKVFFSYNIAAIYAKLNFLEKSMKWLKEPFEFDRNSYIKKVEQDSDFDLLRQNKSFKRFLKTSNIH